MSQQSWDLLKTRKISCFGVILFGHIVCVHTVNSEVCCAFILPTEGECSSHFYNICRILRIVKLLFSHNFIAQDNLIVIATSFIFLKIGPYGHMCCPFLRHSPTLSHLIAHPNEELNSCLSKILSSLHRSLIPHFILVVQLTSNLYLTNLCYFLLHDSHIYSLSS